MLMWRPLRKQKLVVGDQLSGPISINPPSVDMDKRIVHPNAARKNAAVPVLPQLRCPGAWTSYVAYEVDRLKTHVKAIGGSAVYAFVIRRSSIDTEHVDRRGEFLA